METHLATAAVRGRRCYGQRLLLLRLRIGVGRRWRGDVEAVDRVPHGEGAVDLPGEVRPRRGRVAQLPHRRRPRHHRLRLLRLLLRLHVVSRGGSEVGRQDRLEGRPGALLLQHADRLGGLAILCVCIRVE